MFDLRIAHLLLSYHIPAYSPAVYLSAALVETGKTCTTQCIFATQQAILPLGLLVVSIVFSVA
ncbi:hypothetical protein J3Q64DRAFT_1780101 [Phycomyces blakesleeanus]|uniref:Uncharacterized protein n=1 Tax=Phycomyces blakesleeanus TaxID=4837 RepID=A0ABR3AGE1_PHYBL